VFCSSDGFVRPLGMLQGYLAAARRLGVQVHWGVEVTGLSLRKNGTVSAVLTSKGPIGVAATVNAGGAWAAAVAAFAGVELPVVPLRRQVAVTEPCDLLPTGMPMTIFASDGFHLRVREDRVLLLWPTPGAEGRPWDTAVEPSWIEAVVAKAHRRVPVLRRAAVDRSASWGGLYEMSPDKHAILGPAPDCPNLYLANGSSGHGVMHAPALGQLLAEIMTDGAAATLDVTALSPVRFACGRLNPVSELL
jgi:sarcosine oxidase, subunit beta